MKYRHWQIIAAIWLLQTSPVRGQGINPPFPVSGLFASNFDPAVSPNGRYVAFTSDDGGDEDIWIVDLKNGGRRQLTDLSSSEYAPCFAGNNKLYFVSTRDNANGGIFAVDIDGGKIEKIIAGKGYYESPAVSRDGKLLAYVHGDESGKPRIYFYDLKSRLTNPGPLGFDPSFSSDGDRIVFIGYQTDSSDEFSLAIYHLENQTTEFIEAGQGIVAGPAFLPDGVHIVYENHFFDSNRDGAVTLGDKSELSIISLHQDKKTVLLYPGYHFGQPAVAGDGRIYVVSGGNDVYSISSNGIVDAFPEPGTQAAFCDSLIQAISIYSDTLRAAAVCAASYDNYPDSLGAYLWKAIDYYRAMGMTELALLILDSAKENDNPDFRARAELTTAAIRFYSRLKEDPRLAWESTEVEIRSIIQKDNASSESRREAYLKGIELSHKAGRIDNSNSMIIEAILLFTGDDDFISQLELWRLRNAAVSFRGDISDIASLYIDYLDRFADRPELTDSVILNLIGLIRGLDDDVAIVTLENLRSDYSDRDNLTAAFSLEQGKLFEKSGRIDFAGWKYTEAISDCEDCLRVRFEAFGRSGDISFHRNDLANAGLFYDSAESYLSSIKSTSEISRYYYKKGMLFTARGYEILADDPVTAAGYLKNAITINENDHYAVWGLASALSENGDKNAWKTAGSIFVSSAKKEYFDALRKIVEFERAGEVSSLREAMEMLTRSIELDYLYPLPYLSLGYVYCALEKKSGDGRDMYEKAVEISRAGLTLSDNYPYLKSAFYINLGQAYFGLGQYKSAYENFKRAVELDSTVVSGKISDAYLTELGESGFQIDSLASSLENYLILYRHAAVAGDAAAQAGLAAKIGLIQKLSGNYLEAIEYFQIALPYYLSIHDYNKAANLLKAEASCYNSYGNFTAAAVSANDALNMLNRSARRGRMFEDRLKIVFNPLGLEISIISLGPIIYGNSVYPYGFTEAADRAYLTSLADPGRDKTSRDSGKISILKEGDEEGLAIGIYNELGVEYYITGYADSAAQAFKTACEQAMKSESYGLARDYFLNLAAAVFSDSGLIADENWTGAIKRISSNLYDKLTPSDSYSKAILKNILGVCRINETLLYARNTTFDNIKSPEYWFNSLDERAGNTGKALEEGRALFRDGISEVAFADNVALLATLSLNEAIVSYLLGDFDAYNTAMVRALRDAPLSLSEAVYTRAAGFGLLSSNEPAGIDLFGNVLKSIESLPGGQSAKADQELTEGVFNNAIVSAWNTGDTLRSLELTERLSRLKLMTVRDLVSPEIYGDDLQKAYTRQIKKYQSELLALQAEDRKYRAMGPSGQVELKGIRDEQLTVRSRLLAFKDKIGKENRYLIPLLFTDRLPLSQIIENIPVNEICVVAPNIGDKTLVWFVDSDGIRAVSTEELKPSISEYLRNKTVATVIADNQISETIIQSIREAQPGIVFKSGYSLDNSYGTDYDEPSMLDNKAIAFFDGAILDDTSRASVFTDSFNIAPIFPPLNKMEYGWYILDGRLRYDRNNPLKSYWEYPDSLGEDNGKSRLYIYELPGLSIGAFGAILTGFPEIGNPSSKWAIISSILSGGFKTVIVLDDSLELEIRQRFIDRYFEFYSRYNAAESFGMAARAVFEETPVPIGIEYYGENGWDVAARSEKTRQWYDSVIIRGDSSSASGNWKIAFDYYVKGHKLRDSAGLSEVESGDLAQKMINVITRTGNYNDALSAQSTLIDNAGDDLDLRIFRWQEYRDIARDAGQTELSLKSSNEILSIAVLLDDQSMEAESYLHLAEDYSNLGDYAAAEEQARKSISKSESVGDSILLAEANYILAEIEIAAGDDQAARRHLETALELFVIAGSEYWEYQVLSTLGAQYTRTRNYPASRVALSRALAYFESMSDYQFARNCRYNLAVNYLETNMLLKAGEITSEILKDNPSDSEGLILSSKINRRQGDIESSYNDAVTASNMLATGREYRLKSRAYENMGDLFYVMTDYWKAEEQYRLALEFAEQDSTLDGYSILLIKSAILPQVGFETADSILSEIGESVDKFSRDLRDYHLASSNIKKGDKETAGRYLKGILESDNEKSSRSLKWRCAYALSEMSTGEEQWKYLDMADSLYCLYPPEPAYIKDDYHLENTVDDLYGAMAESALSAGEIIGSIDLFERMISAATASLHFSFGNFDSKEADLLDSLSLDKSGLEAFARIKMKLSDENTPYSKLWGLSSATAEGFQRNLGLSQCVLRFYQLPGKMISFYIDSDTIAYNMVEREVERLSESLGKLKDAMINTSRADSALEYWYVALLGPFEELLESKEEILIIPDGSLTVVPFMALKRPDGDYIGETYRIVFSLFLPSEFPSDTPEWLAPCFADEKEGLSIGIVNRVVEALGGCLEAEENTVRFSLGSGYHRNREAGGYLLCDLNPISDHEDNLRLELLWAARAGYSCAISTLWEVPDQAISYFYWSFLKSLSSGRGIVVSRDGASSYLFGRYKGAPFYWGFNTLYHLN